MGHLLRAHFVFFSDFRPGKSYDPGRIPDRLHIADLQRQGKSHRARAYDRFQPALWPDLLYLFLLWGNDHLSRHDRPHGIIRPDLLASQSIQTDVGPIAVELLVRTMQIIDDIYPELMRCLWG